MNKGKLHMIVLLLSLLLMGIAGAINIKNNRPADRIKDTYRHVQVIHKTPDQAKDICPIRDSLTVPYAYRKTVSLDSLPVAERKKTFIDMVLPAFMIAKHRMMRKKALAKQIRNKIVGGKKVSTQDSTFFVNLFKKFKADDWPELQRKLTPHPVSIAIAQAAIESGWGTSRFFTKANNFTGIWSYNDQEQRLAAKLARNGRQVHVRSYNDLIQAAEDYFTTLGRVPAYRSFRKSRMREDDPFQLVSRLTPYSENGRQYTQQVKTIMRYNRLTRYDAYRIHPSYLEPKPAHDKFIHYRSWFAWSRNIFLSVFG
jgi:Bax protein